MTAGEHVIFRDRREAGRRLAQALAQYKETPRTQVLALPRGGVVVGSEISQALLLSLEVWITRKLGVPGNPELAMGALAETGYRHLNQDVLRQYGISNVQLDKEIRRQQEEIVRQITQYRQGKPLPSLAGQTVILVDDGLATGATFYASLAALRGLEVASLVAAVPVAPPHAREELQSRADQVVILECPARFYAIGQFYSNFSQIDDDEVITCLSRGRTDS